MPKNEKIQKALKEYESTMIQAANERRTLINQAESQYKQTKDIAHKKYLKDII